MTRERKLRSEGTAIEYMNRRPAQQSSASKPSQGERAQTCPRNFEYLVLERMIDAYGIVGGEALLVEIC